jgi:hypothetical protein
VGGRVVPSLRKKDRPRRDEASPGTLIPQRDLTATGTIVSPTEAMVVGGPGASQTRLG